MSKLRNLVVVAGLAAVVLLAAGWFLLVSPQRAKAADYKSQAATIRSSTSSLQTQLDMLRAQAKTLPAQRAKLQAIATKVPNNPAEPALVRALTKAADAAGVDLTSIAPSTPTVVATGGSAAGTPTSAGVQVASIALKVTAVGTYFELEQFQANLENLSRALKTSAISLAPGGVKQNAGAVGAGAQSAASGYSGVLTASISASVYMTVERPVAPLTGAGVTPGPTK